MRALMLAEGAFLAKLAALAVVVGIGIIVMGGGLVGLCVYAVVLVVVVVAAAI